MQYILTHITIHNIVLTLNFNNFNALLTCKEVLCNLYYNRPLKGAHTIQTIHRNIIVTVIEGVLGLYLLVYLKYP